MAFKASCWFSRQKPPQAAGAAFLEGVVEQLSFDFYEPPTGRECTKCGKWKPFEEFHKHPEGLYGRNSKCKSCIIAYVKEYHKEHRDARRAYSREWYKKNREKVRAYRIENREKIAEYMKTYKIQYRAKHLEKRRAYSRRYYAEHREERLAYYREWAAENRDVANAAKINYRTRKVNSEGSFTAQEWQQLCEKYDNKCLCCSSDGPLEADHVVPLSKGGSSYIDNIQPLCRLCNSRKRDKTIDYR